MHKTKLKLDKEVGVGDLSDLCTIAFSSANPDAWTLNFGNCIDFQLPTTIFWDVAWSIPSRRLPKKPWNSNNSTIIYQTKMFVTWLKYSASCGEETQIFPITELNFIAKETQIRSKMSFSVNHFSCFQCQRDSNCRTSKIMHRSFCCMHIRN